MQNKSRQHTKQPVEQRSQKDALAISLSQAMAGKTQPQQRPARSDDMAMSLNEAMAAKSTKRQSREATSTGAAGVGISLQQALEAKSRRESQPAILFGAASPRLTKKNDWGGKQKTKHFSHESKCKYLPSHYMGRMQSFGETWGRVRGGGDS